MVEIDENIVIRGSIVTDSGIKEVVTAYEEKGKWSVSAGIFLTDIGEAEEFINCLRVFDKVKEINVPLTMEAR